MIKNNDSILTSDIITKLIGVTTGISFIISIVYDIGYYTTLSYPVSEFPTTFSDHIKSFIYWTPLAFGAAIAYYIKAFIDVSAQNRAPENELHNTFPNQRRTLLILKSTFFILLTASFLFIFLYLIYGEAFRGTLPLCLFIIITAFLFYLLYRIDHTGLILKSSIKFYFLTLALPVIVFIFSHAKNVAYNDLRNTSQLTSITLNNGTKFEAKILRSLDKGFLVHIPKQNEIVFVMISSIDSLRKKIDITTDHGIFKINNSNDISQKK